MPIRQVRRYAELIRQGDSTNADRLALLETHREEVRQRLTEIEQHLELIDYTINLYRERLNCE